MDVIRRWVCYCPVRNRKKGKVLECTNDNGQLEFVIWKMASWWVTINTMIFEEIAKALGINYF